MTTHGIIFAVPGFEYQLVSRVFFINVFTLLYQKIIDLKDSDRQLVDGIETNRV